MALLLRKVKQHRWYKELAEPFLKVDDVPADPLADLQTSENLLSVWEVQEDRSNLIRIVRAVAIGGQRIDHTGYILFDSVHLDAAGIGLQKNEGRSDDKGLTVGIATSCSLGRKFSRLQGCYSSTERQALSRSQCWSRRWRKEFESANYPKAVGRKGRAVKVYRLEMNGASMRKPGGLRFVCLRFSRHRNQN